MEVKSFIESPNHLNTNVFTENTYRQGTLYVPEGKERVYSRFDGWRNFLNIVEMTGTQVASMDIQDISVKADKGGVRIDDAREGTICQVCTSEGKQVKTVTIRESSSFISLPEGQIYIVKVGGKTLKVAL